MKKLLSTCLFLHIHNTLCLKVIVSGYNSKVATYDVNGTSLSPADEWELGVAGEAMTWLQMAGDHIWAPVFLLLSYCSVTVESLIPTITIMMRCTWKKGDKICVCF